MLILSLFGGHFSIEHMTVFKRLFWSHMDMKPCVLSHFLTCTHFICWKIMTRIIGFFVRTAFWALLLPLLSKPSTVKPSEYLTDHLTCSIVLTGTTSRTRSLALPTTWVQCCHKMVTCWPTWCCWTNVLTWRACALTTHHFSTIRGTSSSSTPSTLDTSSWTYQQSLTEVRPHEASFSTGEPLVFWAVFWISPVHFVSSWDMGIQFIPFNKADSGYCCVFMFLKPVITSYLQPAFWFWG